MIHTKKSLQFYMGIIAVVGLLWSCEEKEDPIWNDNEAPTLTSISQTSVKVGYEVTITGKYFSSTANNTVSFNGTAATIISANISIIKVIVPDGAASGEVTVTSDGLVSNGLAYSIIQPIIPTITSIDPTEGKVGSTVTITGTDFSTTPSENVVKFNGKAASVTASTATTITTNVPAGATTGNVTVARDGESNGVLFTVTVSQTLVVEITESWDDVEEGAINGAMANESSDLELGEYDTWTQDGIEQGLQTIGLRFNAITIPAGTVILSANIQFTCDNTGADPVQLTIFGENIGNAPAYTEDFYNVTNRTKTAANVVWDVPEWLNSGDAGSAQKTSDIVSIVQEIVDRGDWAAGNSMNFILMHSGPSIGVTSSSGGREAEAIDGTAASVLTIVYE